MDSEKLKLSEPRSEKAHKASAHSNQWPGVVRLLCFLGLLVGLTFLVDYVISSGLRRIETSKFGVSNKIASGTINADIVISGSSRAEVHYDPRIIQNRTGRTAFNIGLNGSHTDMQLARLKAYLRHNAKPSLLIHNLDIFSLQVTVEGGYDPAQYMPYMDDQALYEAQARINPEQWKHSFIPLYGYVIDDCCFTWLQGLGGFFGWNPVEDHFMGFQPRHVPWTRDFERFKATNPEGITVEIQPEGVRAMDELLQICKERGIAVLMVYSPEYAEMQALTNNRDQVFARFEDLSKKFRVDFLDYSASPISCSKENFYNSQHLNADGAAAFSMDLAARITSDPGLGRPVAFGALSY